MDMKVVAAILQIVMTSTCLSTSVSLTDIDMGISAKISTATIYGKRVDLQPKQLPEYRRSVLAFTRIPYAEPPLGKLRFSGPVPKVVHGDFDATKPSAACSQVSLPNNNLGMEMSEDCLFLDVFVPEPKPESAAVLFWIHGGGFHIGAGSIPAELPIPLASFGDVIVVTCNYRLGPLGFMTTGNESIPANIGLLDQRQALIWVRENIHAFGGDPDRVTIFGESAGSWSVNFHLLSPMSSGLFARAIMQSGAVGHKWSNHANMEEAVHLTSRVAKLVGCDAEESSDELVACLRKVPAKNFFDIYGHLSPIFGEMYFRPVADGQFIPDDPAKLSSEGRFNEADVMNGVAADEGAYFIFAAIGGTSKPTFDLKAYREWIESRFDTRESSVIDMIAFIYSTEEQMRNPNAEYFPSVNKMLGDLCMLCPTFAMSESLAKVDRNVYTYIMTHVPSHSAWGKDYTWLGACHVDDIPYVFGSPLMFDPEEDIDCALTGRFGNPEEVKMSLQMMKYWSNFAKTGDPNLSDKDEDNSISSYPVWPRFTIQEPGYKELSKTFDNRAGTADARECYFINNVLPDISKTYAETARLKSLLEEKVSADSGNTCDDPETCP